MKHKKVTNIIINAIIILLMGVVSLTLFQVYYIFNHNNLEVKPYEKVNLNTPKMEYTLTKSEIKKLVADLYDTPHIYIERDNFKDERLGHSSIILRTTEIKKGLDLAEYATTYAHELAHVKYQVVDETFTEFKAFVTLYESGNAELQNMALRHIQATIYGGYDGTEYDCGYYVIEYLKEKGVL